MSIVVRFSPIALTAKKYDETIRQIKNAGEWLRPGSTTTSASARMAP